MRANETSATSDEDRCHNFLSGGKNTKVIIS